MATSVAELLPAQICPQANYLDGTLLSAHSTGNSLQPGETLTPFLIVSWDEQEAQEFV